MPQTFYLSDLSIPGTTHKQVTTTVPADTDSTGWRLLDNSFPPHYTGFPAWSFLSSGNILAAYNFNATYPLPTKTEFGSGFRIMDKITGHLAGNSGAINVRVHTNIHDYISGDLNYKLTARVYKGSDPSLFLAHEITNTLCQTNLLNIKNNATQNVVIPLIFNTDVEFNSEYMFVVMGFENYNFGYTSMAGGTDYRYDFIIDYGSGTTITIPSFGPRIVSENVCAPVGHPEMYIYISPDGEQYPLDVDGSRVVLNDQGTGTPPFEYVTQRGPFQHGETLVTFHARPRVVQLMINQRYNNRDNYWNGRRNLLAQLSPRKQAVDGLVDTGVLRKILSTGEKRDLNCLIIEGPKFEPRHEDTWQEHSYTEALRFQAFDPIYFDPKVKSYTFDQQGSQLVFPATFPITFTTIMQDLTFQYMGSWLTYPTFVITGPMAFLYIVNNSTGEKIEITYNLAVGETLTIDLQYGNKQVTKNDGTNLMPAVSSDSDIGTFHLTETNLGLNNIHLHMVGVSGASQAVMQWYDKYVGL